MAVVTVQGGASFSLLHLSDEQVRKHLSQLCLQGDAQKISLLAGEVPERVKGLLSGRLDADGYSGLHFAAAGGHLHLTRELISLGCEVDAKDGKMQTPLHLACAEDRAEVALELVMAKCNVDAEDANQQTALHRAAVMSPDATQVLLDHSEANPRLTDGTQSTPLLLAAGHGRTEQMALLLAKDPLLAHAVNECRWTALHLAAHGKEMKKSSMKGVKFLPAVKMLLEAKARVDAVDEDSRTALHRAADTGNGETVSALLAADADMMAADISRWTPLHFACQAGHLTVVRLLLGAKAAVQQREPTCITPLALATMENQVKVAEVLVKHKADPNLRGNGLASAAMVARKNPEQYNDILSLFELGFVNHAD